MVFFGVTSNFAAPLGCPPCRAARGVGPRHGPASAGGMSRTTRP